jgi:hypothetical protein
VLFIDLFDHSQIKRGDIVQSNLGDKRERTWLVLRALRVRRKMGSVPRYRLWMARWWQLEPEMRVRLFQSAERNGGQQTIFFKRYPAKRKRTFEQLMAE